MTFILSRFLSLRVLNPGLDLSHKRSYRILQDKLREKILGADQGGRSSPLPTGVRDGKVRAAETAGVKKGSPEVQEPEVSGR